MCRGAWENRFRRPFNAESGFTLVETALAMAILGIAIGACIASFSMAMRTVNTATNQMAAVHALRNEVELLRTNSFTSPALNVGTKMFTNTTFTGTATLTFAGTYTVASINSGVKSISVSLPYRNWIHRNSTNTFGGYSTNTLTTYLYSGLHP